MHWILLLTLASGLTIPVETTEEACRMTAAAFVMGTTVKVRLTPDHEVEAVGAECKQEAGA